ncbi:MAG: hypothetical protein WC539_03785 [Nitrospirota bacterium]
MTLSTLFHTKIPTCRQDIILICFAVKEEAARFQKELSRFFGVQVLLTGMGKENARHALLSFLESQTPQLVLSCGFAGGLDPHLQFGTVVYTDNDSDQYSRILERLGAQRVRLHCSSRVVVTREEKHLVHEKTGADAVDMESEYIRAICKERNIPCITLRIILDTASDALPFDFNALMNKNNTISPIRLALSVVASLHKIPHMLALRKKSFLASDKLAKIVCEFLIILSRYSDKKHV